MVSELSEKEFPHPKNKKFKNIKILTGEVESQNCFTFVIFVFF